MKLTQKRKIKKAVLIIFMVLLALIYVYPIFLMCINAVKPFGEVVTDVIKLPSRPEWGNLTYVIDKMKYGKLFFNTLVITVIGILGIVVFSKAPSFFFAGCLYHGSKEKQVYPNSKSNYHHTYADSFSDDYDTTVKADDDASLFGKQSWPWNSVLGIWRSHGNLYFL